MVSEDITLGSQLFRKLFSMSHLHGEPPSCDMSKIFVLHSPFIPHSKTAAPEIYTITVCNTLYGEIEGYQLHFGSEY